MNIRLSLLLMMVCSVSLMASKEVEAQIFDVKDSSLFEHYYEGGAPVFNGDDVSLDLENSGYSGALNGAVLSSDEGILTYDDSTTPFKGMFLNNASWESEADHAEGWTWEMRFRIDAANVEDRNISLRIGDLESTHDVILTIGKDYILNVGDKNVVDNYDLTNDFHTLRLAHKAGAGATEYWIDDVLYTRKTGTFAGGDTHWLGDGSGSGTSTGGITYIDYIRWTGQGGFIPVPFTGDFNDDQFVDGSDLAVWESSFGLNAGGDADQTGVTNGKDFLTWQRTFTGPTSFGVSVAVPEPSTLMLTTCLLSLVVVARRK